jgi:purine nucleoside phosphorylase
MPEAALAKEAGMRYANLSLVVNWGAGLTNEEITMEEIHANLDGGMQHVVNLIGNLDS